MGSPIRPDTARSDAHFTISWKLWRSTQTDSYLEPLYQGRSPHFPSRKEDGISFRNLKQEDGYRETDRRMDGQADRRIAVTLRNRQVLVCIYIYIYVYISIYIYMHTNVCIHIHIYICIYIYTYMYIHQVLLVRGHHSATTSPIICLCLSLCYWGRVVYVCYVVFVVCVFYVLNVIYYLCCYLYYYYQQQQQQQYVFVTVAVDVVVQDERGAVERKNINNI